MSEPPAQMRYKELENALKERNISRWEMEQLLAEEIIVGHKLRPKGRKYYHWSEVKAALKLKE